MWYNQSGSIEIFPIFGFTDLQILGIIFRSREYTEFEKYSDYVVTLKQVI